MANISSDVINDADKLRAYLLSHKVVTLRQELKNSNIRSQKGLDRSKIWGKELCYLLKVYYSILDSILYSILQYTRQYTRQYTIQYTTVY